MTTPHTASPADRQDDHGEHDEHGGQAVEPIAIIGLACRVPGAGDARRFWDNLAEGAEAIRYYSPDEQRELGVAEHVLNDPNFVPAAMVLDDHDSIDAAFFGMSIREAEIRDPQHRLFLELAHTALEDAGYDSTRYPGEIGVYGGVGPDVYQWINIRSNPKAYANAGWLAVMVSNHADYCATLASYKLDLRGPSITLHTACSTSLVAVHTACEALRNGECDMALTGGATIEVPAGHGYIYDDDGITSPDGHCRAFDAGGKGTIWGSGGGIVVLKRLADALEDGDNVRAVILGNAINNDGANKVGFSAPSVEGQSAVVAQALGVAGVDARTVSYVEAHGTGTALGDPIEVGALSNVFGQASPDTGWCAIGSVKTNIGHLGQSAGIAGVIKTVLALEHGTIPPSLHYESPNPRIDFGENPFYVNASLAKWEANGAPRRAGVSSFGIGGTNAHLVLEEAPARDRPAREPRPLHLLHVSARTETALEASCERLAAHLDGDRDLDLADVAFTLREGRRRMGRRAVVVAADIDEAVAALRDPRRLVTGAVPRRTPQVALLFSGQGAQYAGMGAQLYEAEQVFRDAVDECAAILAGELGEDIRETVLTRGGDGDERLRQTRLTQPALFTVEYALARLWLSWGLEPAAMIGHSIGEYAAATVAGVFDLPGALRLVAARGALMQEMPPGAMLAVPLDEEEVRTRLPADLAVATVNAPGTCVVAGPAEAVDAFASELAAEGVAGTPLRTSHAFHSPMMEPILGRFRQLVEETPRSAPRMPFVSNVSGTWITAEEATDPSYWARHLREAVRFGAGVETLLNEGEWLFVECGPGRQLSSLVRMQLGRDAARPAPSLPGPRDKGSDLHTLYAAAGALWTRGIDLTGPAAEGRRVSLPGYPWERKRAWIEPAEGVGPLAVVPHIGGEANLPLEEWFTVPAWRQAPRAPGSPEPIGRCLAFVDDGTAGLVAALREAGAEVVEVRPGDAYGRAGDGVHTVRPAEPADYEALISDLGDVPGRIVHAWALSGSPAAGPEAALQAQDRGFFSLLTLVQALSAAEPPETRLDVLTAGTRAVTGRDVTRPEHATVAGIARVVPLEAPWLTVRHVDLDPVEPLADPAAVLAELGGDADVALRGGRRWIEEWERVTVPGADGGAPPPIGPDDVVLVTGGLGGIGITLAEDLARRAGARLVLASRSGLPPESEWDARAADGGPAARAIAAVRRMRDSGTEVMVAAADVTDAAALRRAREETLARFGRLDVIVHAAGVAGGGMAEVKERAAAERVLAPKIGGTLALRDAFGDLDLRAVVLCSSVTAVAGGFGQVDYCAANAFMDAHASGEHGWPCRVVSLDWGGWLEVGMAAEAEAPSAFRALQRGMRSTPVDHPIVTEMLSGEAGAAWAAGEVSAQTHWVLDEHRMTPVPVMPGTGYVETAHRAAATALPAADGDGTVIELRDLTFTEPMPVPDGEAAQIRVTLTPEADGIDMRISSRVGGEVRDHVRGGAGRIDPGTAPVADIAAVRARCDQADGRGGVPLSSLLSYGPHWRNLRSWYMGEGEALAFLHAEGIVAADLDRWVLHPGMLDEATSFARISVEGHYLPLSYGRVVVRGAMPAKMWSHLVFRDSGTDEVIVADVTLYDEDGREVVAITDYVLRRVDPDRVMGVVTRKDPAGAGPAGAPAQQEGAGADRGPGIRPADGAEAFTRMLATPLGPQVAVTATPLPAILEETRALTQETVETAVGEGAASAAARRASDGFVAPRTEMEATLARLWGEVLGGEEIGVEDDFFELGGNSLIGVQFLALLRKQIGVRLPMRTLFEAPTIAAFAALVAADEASPPEPGESGDGGTTIPRLPRSTDSGTGGVGA
ncbi:SDR family NAD(P)-dependent oxidoreductase [Spirillospora sp. NPDC048823]|uniref:type I polyketide synthase n=1 Tax=unclassified Spirillospora TaxID=2642701 RepID=UPI00371B7BC2